MLFANNRGTGMNFGFPDVCLTPAAPSPLPIPYPNFGPNAMAMPFSPTVKFTFMPALNMLSKILMTTGDITPAAANYAASRPIELYDTARLAEQVRAAMRGAGSGQA